MREKELRLALICYGGVSLAVYMHGITREIWHLIRASRAFHTSEPATGSSEAVYRDLIADMERLSGTRLRVLSDIISGASAGGINGVFLAQAITTGQSLEPLTDLWLRNADVETLIDPDARPLSRFSKFWATPIAWAILRRRGGAVDKSVSEDAKDEVATKLSRFVRARWFKPPFGGRGFSRLLLDALQAMAGTGDGQSLLPGRQPLDLFVTVTDFHGHSETLRLNSPAFVTETEHRITIGFSTRGATPLAHVAELVFAARATASFPGAFPPFSVGELDSLLKITKTDWPSRDAFLQRILPQQFAAGEAEETILSTDLCSPMRRFRKRLMRYAIALRAARWTGALFTSIPNPACQASVCAAVRAERKKPTPKSLVSLPPYLVRLRISRASSRSVIA
jgi:patatin-related protein